MQVPRRFQTPPIIFVHALSPAFDIRRNYDQASTGPQDAIAFLHEQKRIVNMFDNMVHNNNIKILGRKVLRV